MVDPCAIEKAIQKITGQESFVRELLVGTLDWDFKSDNPEDWFFDVKPEELNLVDEKLEVFQLRPLTNTQPWGIFFIVFPDERIPVLTLRRILRALVKKKRASSKAADRATWELEDLLFICTHDWKKYTFVHFAQSEDIKKAARITSFDWQPDLPHRTILEFNIPHLEWPDDTEKVAMWRAQWLQAFDVEKVTKRFYQEYERVFCYVEDKITGFGTNKESKRLFAQKLFNRLMFIAFIQKKGWLKFNNSIDYLNVLWKDHTDNKEEYENFYDHRLKILFFSALNNADGRDLMSSNRSGLKECVGDVRYLNGGLFEKEPDDELPGVKVPDEAIKRILDELFNCFNFTVTESTPLDQEVAVDPEMLGKVFEELVTGRHESGSYYTPKTVVSFMCREALKGYLDGYDKLVDYKNADDISVPQARKLLEKLSSLRICDPACGSGAYLVGMLHEIHAIMQELDSRTKQETARDDYKRKLEIIQNNLYGVDKDSFAVNIAKLRLWLTLAVEFEGPKPEPLPNLDFKIELGDSLTAKITKYGEEKTELLDSLILQLSQSKSDFIHHHGNLNELRIEINQLKRSLESFRTEKPPAGAFDWLIEFAEVFHEGGFDVLIANPPYGLDCADPLRYMYFPKKDHAKKQSKNEPQSKNSYGLFMARALQLLKPAGFFTFIVSDTWRTIRTHRPLRQKLLKETTVKHVLDLPGWIFGATVTTCILSLINKPASEEHKLIAGDLRNLPPGNWIGLEYNLAAVAEHGIDCQTLTYARYTYPQKLISTYSNYSFFIGSHNIFRMFQCDSYVMLRKLADCKDGMTTGDNKYYLRKSQGARGSYEIVDKTKVLSDFQISKLTDQEKLNGIDPKNYNGRCYVPYDKGGESDSDEGWLPNYYVPSKYFINWSTSSVKRLNDLTIGERKKIYGESDIDKSDFGKKAAFIRNQHCYFEFGLTFSRTGQYSPTFRLNSGSVFDSKSNFIQCNNINAIHLLAYLASRFCRYFIKTFLCHSVQSEAEAIEDYLLPKDLNQEKTLIDHVNKIVNQQKHNLSYPYHLHEQKEIDKLVYQLYGLYDDDIREVELWYCRRYTKLAEAQGFIDEVKGKYKSHLERCEYIMSKPPEYWKSNPVLELIGNGEGEQTEFKETLAVDIKTGEKSDGLVMSSLKTIAGFLNTDGGSLLIGVSDKGEIKGLEPDYKQCRKSDKDGLEQKIRSFLESRFDPTPLGKVKISVEMLREGDVCRIDVEKSAEIIHLDGDVYIRDGNRTKKQSGRDLTDWIKKRSM